MPGIPTVSSKSLSLRIELHRNGVSVSAYVPHQGKPDDKCPMCDDGHEISYVYKTIDEMIKELPGFISTLKEEAGVNSDNPTKHESDMGNMKKEDY